MQRLEVSGVVRPIYGSTHIWVVRRQMFKGFVLVLESEFVHRELVFGIFLLNLVSPGPKIFNVFLIYVVLISTFTLSLFSRMFSAYFQENKMDA